MHGCRRLWVVIALALCSGCEVGRTMFQMDSNSGSPFMGIDLLPSRKTSSIRRAPQQETLPVKNATAQTPVQLADAAPVRKEASLLESLKLKRPDKIPLAMTPPDGEVNAGPREEFR